MNAPPTNAFVLVADGDVQGAIRRLNHLLKKGGWHRDLKRHEEYLKPGERKRMKSHRARKKARKIELRRNSVPEYKGRPRRPDWVPSAASPPAAA